MIRYTMMAALAALVLGCGDEPAPVPTFEELISKWELSFGDEAIDGNLMGRIRFARDMQPMDCTVSDVNAICYSPSNVCNSEEFVTVCFNDKAELIGCIWDNAPDAMGPAQVQQITSGDGSPRAVVAPEGWQQPKQGWILCDDQSLPRS